MTAEYRGMTDTEFLAHLEKIQAESRNPDEARRALRMMGYPFQALVFERNGTVVVHAFSPAWNPYWVPPVRK